VRPNYGDPGGFEPSTYTLAGIRLPWNQPGQPFYLDAGELLDELFSRFERLTDAEDLEKILQRLLGAQCFTLGVVYGIGEAFVVNIADLLGLVKTFLLAEFYDVTRRNPAWTVSHPGGIAKYLTAQVLNEYFGEEIANAAQERDALIFELKYAFEHPEEFFGRLAEEYSDKFRVFLKFSSDPSLESQFQAGSLFGGLLLEVLAVIVAGTALVKFAGRIPRLAKLAESLKGKVVRRTVVAGGTPEAAGGPPPIVPRANPVLKERKAIEPDPPPPVAPPEPPPKPKLTSPVTANSIVADENLLIAMDRRAKGLDLNSAQQAVLAQIDRRPDSPLLVTQELFDKVSGTMDMSKLRVLEATVARESAEYQAVLKQLEEARVGAMKGVEDRKLIADTLFAKADPGVVPTFATADKGIVNRMLFMSGTDPAKLGKPVAEAFPNGFEVPIGDKKIKVLPLKTK
jgi:hypothetical protein